MITDKLHKQLDLLETLAHRNNDDFREVAGMTIERMRAEVNRLKELELAGVIAAVRGGEHVTA